MPRPEAAIIEIIERTNQADPDIIIPNDIRINGKSVLAPANHPVEVHGITLGDGDVVQVTLTLFAKRITVGHEASARIAKPDATVTQDQVVAALRDAGHTNPLPGK